VRNSGGICTFGFGRGEGENRADQAVSSLWETPLLQRGEAVASARSLLVSILGGPDLRLREVGSVMDAVKSKVREGTEIHMGTVQDAGWSNRLLVTVIVSEQWAAAAATAAEEPAKDEDDVVSGKKERKPRAAQRKLGLEPYGKGRFKGMEPTIFDGEDLDVPTFVRRGLAIEK
jgi:cell division protein FtsZ